MGNYLAPDIQKPPTNFQSEVSSENSKPNETKENGRGRYIISTQNRSRFLIELPLGQFSLERRFPAFSKSFLSLLFRRLVITVYANRGHPLTTKYLRIRICQ